MIATFYRFVLSFTIFGSGLVAFTRPLDTDDTGIVAPGEWELEGGIDLVRTAQAESWVFTPVLAYGIHDRLQVDFGCDYLVEIGETGDLASRSLNPSLQFKTVLWNSIDSDLSFGLKGNMGWPMKLSGAAENLERHGHLRLLATKVLGATELDFNAGYDFTGAWGGGGDAWIASIGFRHTVSTALSWVGEIFSTIPEPRGPAQGLVAVGASFAGWEHLTIDALLGTGVGRESPDLRVVIGFVRTL